VIVISIEAERARQANNIPRAHRCAAKHVRPYVGEEVRLVLKKPIPKGKPKSLRCTIVGVDVAGITFSPGISEKVSTQSFSSIKQVEVL
jgi:hypothetical protein